MLAMQNADANFFVPESDIASLTPVYPNRVRIVLADGTVAHRPGPPPKGPWVPLHDSWVTPHHLRREGEHWKDPGDYLYPYLPLADPEVEPEETDLPEGLIAFEMHQGEYFWRTDLGLQECDLKPEQAQQLYPQLCLVGRSHLVNMQRVRRYGVRKNENKVGWFQLDNGERFEFSYRLFPAAYKALGVDSLNLIDPSQRGVLLHLRDFPYDLTSGDPERIRRDCPTPQLFLCNLIWQTVLQNLQGQSNDYGRDALSFARHPCASAGARCGYSLAKKDLSRAFSRLVHCDGVVNFRQLGFQESDSTRRVVGKTRPEVLLVAHYSLATTVLPEATRWGISLLLSKPSEDRLALENLVPQLPSPGYVFFLHITDSEQKKMLRILDHLEMGRLATPVCLAQLSDLKEGLEKLPKPYTLPAREAFRRIPLQAREGWLLMADPEEIAAWSPTRFSRWRVTLADGQVAHHPGPVPPGPWVGLGEHWVQPQLLGQGKDPAGFQLPDLPLPASSPQPPSPPIQAGPALPCGPAQVIYLEDGPCGAHWWLDDGSKIPAGMSGELAALQHPGLVRHTQRHWVHHNRIRLTNTRVSLLDGNVELPRTASLYSHHLQQVLGISDFGQLAADDYNLLCMGIRDFPFEIASAPAAVLRRFFPTAHVLICNIIYQTFDMHQKTGVFPYGNTFSAYFYRPLQATLYRAGFLTRSQVRAPWRVYSAKDRQMFIFLRAIYAMVYHYRLFTYQEFGFKDAFPEDRIIGTQRPQQILLVEKGDQIEAFGRQVQQELGLTVLILKGYPSLLASEYFAAQLKQRGICEVEVYSYGDHDYAGWDIGPAFIRQLNFYGIQCTLLARLVSPECFTPAELPIVSHSLPTPTAESVTRIKRWLREGGGVNGEARAIYANWLFPYPRVRSRLEALLA